jgi:hypothetical protein
MIRWSILCLFCAIFASYPAKGEDNVKDAIKKAREKGASVSSITQIYSQRLMLSFPDGFKMVFEKTNGGSYIQESVLEDETVDQWSQMVTLTGAKGLAGNPNTSPQRFLEGIASGFKRACPDTFSAKPLGPTKISERDAFVALASCGTLESGAKKHSESALLVAIKGSDDYYTIQWAERQAASSQPINLDDAKWQDRLKKLNPIKLCPVVPGEARPYPSCIDKK